MENGKNMRVLGSINGTSVFQDADGDVWVANRFELPDDDRDPDGVCIFFKNEDAADFCLRLLDLLRDAQK